MHTIRGGPLASSLLAISEFLGEREDEDDVYEGGLANEPTNLAGLLTEHFASVLETIDRGRWGQWLLDRKLAEQGRLVLVHLDSGYSVAVAARPDWAALVARKEWASASDIGELIYAMRDLEYARWLGLLPESRTV